MSDSPLPLVSLRQYAKRRGVSPMAVSDACKAGRLKGCVVRDPATGRVMGITDVFLADREWMANSDMKMAPIAVQERALELAKRNAEGLAAAGLELAPIADAASGSPNEDTLASASARAKHWEAELKELKYREAAGELVLAAEVERKISGEYAACKTKLLAIPSRARQALPHLSVEDMAGIEKLIREALEDLATGAGE